MGISVLLSFYFYGPCLYMSPSLHGPVYSLLSLTSASCWWTFAAAVELSGVASLLPFILQKSFASSKVNFGSATNQNSDPSMKIDVSWCPAEKHNTETLTHFFFYSENRHIKPSNRQEIILLVDRQRK